MATLKAEIEMSRSASSGVLKSLARSVTMCACIAAVVASTGCQALVKGIPVSRVPRQILEGELKDEFIDINLLRLRQDPPEYYALGPGDVLGLHIPNIVALSRESVLPPVHYPQDASLPPAVGQPIVIREDGTVALPFIDAVNVEGMSLIEATDSIREAYTATENPVAQQDEQVILTMIRQRTNRVLVIREEAGGMGGGNKRGTGHILDLPAYQNDVLRALSKTGGMPGVDAENQVYIYRGMFEDGMDYDEILTSHCLANCEDPCFCNEGPLPDPPNVTRIPLRYPPNRAPSFTEDDVLLGDGDIVIIRSRDSEKFYTAGLLGGGEWLMPRDRDLDVVEAIAMTGGQLGAVGVGFGGLGQRQFGGQSANTAWCRPSEVIVMRELPCGDQISIEIDLNTAMTDSSERIIIKSGDVIMLRYTLVEEIGNVMLNLMQFNFLVTGLNGGL